MSIFLEDNRIPTASDEEVYLFPASFAQQRLWFIDQLALHNPVYNIIRAYSLHGSLNLKALTHSINALFERHESLRTAFTIVNDSLHQAILPELNFQFEQKLVEELASSSGTFIDLRHLPPEERESTRQQILIREAHRPFDLTQAPLFRLLLIQHDKQAYTLLCNIHHIVADGHSLNIFFNELSLLYNWYLTSDEHAPHPLPPLPLQYADFSDWQHQQWELGAEQKTLSFWQKQLKGELPDLALPTDHKRPTTSSFRGARYPIELDSQLVTALNNLSQQTGGTLYMTLLAAFQTMLHRYTGQTDILVGSPVAGRPQQELDAVVGFFANMLVLRANWQGDPTFLKLLHQVQETAVQAFAHQDVPLEKLLEMDQSSRQTSYRPLFKTVFALQNDPPTQLTLTDVEIVPSSVEIRTAKFDLTLSLVPSDQGLTGWWEYSTDLFNEDTIARLTGHFQTLLAGIVANPQQRLSELPLLTTSERENILFIWNQTATNYPRQQTIHQLFEAQAAQTPTATALIFQDQQLTYQQLNERANQVAHLLLTTGIQPNELVGLAMERSLEMIIATLGILKAGAAYLPLDPSYPPERLAFMLQDTRTTVFLAQQSIKAANQLPAVGKTIWLDSEWHLVEQHSQANPDILTTPNHLAYVMYTSGSTGQPKGVSITHRNVVRLVKETNYLPFTADETFLQFAPVSFDAATLEIWGSLLNGARLVIFPPHTPSLAELGRFLRQHQVTTLWLTAGLFHLMVEQHLDDLQSLHYLLAGGDVLSVGHVRRVLSTLPNCQLINGYGPTENTTFTTCHPITSMDDVGDTVPIGRPIANTTVYILDKQRQPVPIGLPGELYIGGDGLARNYFNRPALTAEKFIPNPFLQDGALVSQPPSPALYKTGDLVRYRPDGVIEFLGRIDNQVKIRGFRVELGEIEATLQQHPAVNQVIVLVRQVSDELEQQLVAYLVTEESASNATELRRYLQTSLPDYMIPAYFVFLAAMPLNANGKVDRQALPAPDRNRPSNAASFVPPRTPLEKMLATIWGDVLHMNQVGVDDNFFALGGHSLLATQVTSRIRRLLKVELPLRYLFETPTIAGLAKMIEADVSTPIATLPPIEPSTQETHTLSFAQQRLWFLHHLEPDSANYNMPQALSLTGSLDVTALEKSLHHLIDRHEALHTCFVAVDGQPQGVVASSDSFNLVQINLCHLVDEERETAVHNHITADSHRPFDLSNGPLLRAVLFHLSGTEYVLYLNLHHIACDGWSFTIFYQELGQLYAAYTGSNSPNLPELPIQYSDFAAWQRHWLQGEVLGRQLTYWRQQLQAAPTLLDLPTDKPRRPLAAARGAACPVHLPVQLSQQLKQLSQREGVTLFMTLLAAFQTLLHRYSRQDDILVGTPIANRTQQEIEGVIGFFVNTLVLRARLGENPSFSQLLQQVRETALGAYTHQDLPFEKLVDELQPERSLSHTPLFQVMFALQDAATPTPTLDGLNAQFLPVAVNLRKFDLNLGLTDKPDGLTGVLSYNADLFNQDTIARLVTHFQTLLKAIVSDPGKKVANLPLLTAEERLQLHRWNETKVPFPVDHCIHHLFEKQVNKTPDSIALAFKDETLTYRQLNQRANQLAHWLLAQGVGPEALVGVYMERSLEMVIALLGILKAGGAYLPLDPTYPAKRLAYMVDDAQITTLLTQNHLKSNDRGAIMDQPSLTTVLALDKMRPRLSPYSKQNPSSAVQPDNLMYVLYTSGTTGRPKGVMNIHRALSNRLHWMQRAYQLAEADRVLQKTPFSFDVSGWEFFWPLLTGAQLVIAEPEGHKDSVYLARLIEEVGITTIHFVPSMLQVFIQELAHRPCPSLKRVICSGEALPVALQNRFLTLSNAELHNLYGPTEAAIDVTTWACRLEEEQTTVPIGQPIDNIQLYILNKEGQPVPVGVAGELYIGGVGLARGYWRRPALTAEKFVPNPFAEEDSSAVLYRTGDLARYRADGNIEFLGRLDHQVKLRGFRIELGEIGAQLNQHPAVRESVLLAWEEQLVAYLVTEAPAPTVAELRRYLQNSLPDYMIPAHFVFLESLPLNPNGKVDRRALPTPDVDRSGSEVRFMPPRTPLEEMLATIWGDILHLDQVGIYDNFFTLGGHSLVATQVTSRIRHLLQIELPLRHLFEAPTIAGLAAVMETAVAPSTRPPIHPGNQDNKPLSFAQQRLWFLHHLEPDSTSYNMPQAYRLTGQLNVSALEQSLHHLIGRHETLHTCFMAVDGQPRPVAASLDLLNLTQIDLIHLPVEEQETAVHNHITTDSHHPFDLNAGPLLRAILFRLDETEHILYLNLHHIACDGWSFTTFFQELGQLYAAYVDGEFPDLPEPPIQYSDFAAWQRNWLQGEVLDSQLDYWRHKLENVPTLLDLPTDKPRRPLATTKGATHPIHFPAQLSQQLKQLSRQEGVTLFMTLLAAFQTLLHRYSRQDDILVGTPIANRNQQEIEEVIGFFVNTLVLRARLGHNPTFSQLLQQVRETALEAYAHQDLPFEKLVDELQPERSLTHTPLFQVMFALQDTAVPQPTFSDLTTEPLPIEADLRKFDLNLGLRDMPDGLCGVLAYNADLFQPDTIARLATHFQTLLEAIVDDPGQTVSTLPLLTAAERQQLLYSWNDTVVPFSTDRCLHHLFEEQVAKTPDNIALAFNDQTLTYRQLNQRANQLAHWLRAQDVGPEVLVAVYLERSLELVVVILGILKAGGAYLPLDPAYPSQRLAFMLEDSQASLLLTQASLQTAVSTTSSRIISLDSAWPTIAQASQVNPRSSVSPENLAYVLYTSGSTGQPKGSLIPHRGLVNYLLWCQEAYPLQAGQGAPVHSSISFDLTITGLFGPLLAGRQVHLLPEDAGVESLGLALQDNQDFSLVKITPAHLQLLAEQIPAEQATGGTHAFVIGGENLLASRLAFWQENAPDTLLINEYGPTETVVGCSVYQVTGQEKAGDAVPIGRPIANTQLYILDAHMQPVPIGVPGELYIGGRGVSRGYLDRPALTAEKFLPNPFSTAVSILYKTGDLARYRADGNIEFLGRIDHQIKLRGFRIEPGEIEAQLNQHPVIRESVLLVRDEQLVAYLAAEEPIPTTAELRQRLQNSLPDYMIPTRFVFLGQLPLNANGKVDRRALPAPDMTRSGSEASFVSPRSPLEDMLAAIWRDLLQLEQIGVHDNFFALGGHSLLAMQLTSRIRQLLKIELPVRHLFEAPTIAGLAELMETTTSATARPPIQPSKQDSKLLSFAQQRLWFLHHLEPDSTSYNMPQAYRLTGSLDVRALDQSLHHLIGRHETLHTCFMTVDGQPKLAPVSPDSFRLVEIDLSHLPVEERETAVYNQITADNQQPFDLNAGPLLRATLFRLEETEHILYLNLHHIACDGWSFTTFFQELGQLYAAYVDGEFPDLPEPPIQYSDFAAWQRNWLQGEVLDSQIVYWRHKLENAPTLLDLPTDQPRRPLAVMKGAAHPIHFPAQLTQQLKQLSQQEGVTLFMTLLAAFQTLLHRYSRQDDILVGTPIANRNQQEIEEVIGFFVNTLVLRARLGHNPSFSQLLQQVRETALEAYAHQDLPFEKLVDELQPERSLTHTPLFQVMFALQDTAVPQPNFNNLTTTPLQLKNSTAKFDLELGLVDTPHGLSGVLSYNADLFQADTIARLAVHFQTLLAGIVANPTLAISDLPLMTAAERQQQLVTFNETLATIPNSLDFNHLFEAQVARTPHSVAVTLVQGKGSLTYQQLNQQANQLAHALQTHGVGSETIVAIYMERSLEMIVALLGILKAGGAYLPLDPKLPLERIAFMLADTQTPVILTQKSLQGNIQPLAANNHLCLSLDTDWDTAVADQPITSPIATASPENLAYVIYTSGSTGQPKGVMISRRSFVHYVTAGMAHIGLGPDDTLLQFASISFDTAVEEIFGSLLYGCRLLLRDEVIISSVGRFLETCAAESVTILDLPPAYWHTVASELAAGHFQLPPTIRFIFLGGEKISPSQLELWRTFLLEHVRLVNGYGPTEATVVATVCDLVGPDAVRTASLAPIGKPIANAQAYILDDHRQPVPIGVTGELYIGGMGVARGYLNRPDMTAEKFIPNPFLKAEGSRQNEDFRFSLYRTGDLVRYLPDGNIEFLGRIDNQVKIRGFRVELGEIETHLTAHADVQATAVILRQEPSGHKRLIAYVVPVGEAVNSADLRAYLLQKLPEYMVPTAFVQLDHFPVTISGKLDRKRLPAPDQLDQDFTAPRNPIERQLADIWSNTLGLAQVGIHDNFFSVGGDSILSIQIASRAHQAGLHLTPGQLFQYQTIAELASVVTEVTDGAGAKTVVQGIVTGPVPLTPIQKWFFDQALVDSHHYNQSLLLAVPPNLEPALLAKALQQLLQHHDALRLRFKEDGETCQQVNTGLGQVVPFHRIDLSDLAPTEQTQAIEKLASHYQAQLNLAAGPLLQMVYFQLGLQQTGRLLIAIHHLAVDRVSWRILLEDLNLAYEQLYRDQIPQLPAKTTSFKAWSERLSEYAQSDRLLAELPYWTAAQRTQVTPLPVDYPAVTDLNTVISANTLTVSLSPEETRSLLQRASVAYNTQINDLLLAALAQAFTDWTDSATFLVDLEGHGREALFADVDLSRTVGWFTSLFPVLLELPSTVSEEVLLKSVKEQLRAIPQRGIGYGLLRYLNHDHKIVNQLATLPQAQVSFNYLGQLDGTLDENAWFNVTNESSGSDVSLHSKRSHLIEIIGFVRDGQLHFNWAYDQNVHFHETIARLAGGVQTALQALIHHCLLPDVGSYTPSDFPLAKLDQSQLEQLIATVTQATGRQSKLQIEDIYPLSPMQQGMLFHTLYDPPSSLYFEQTSLTLGGNLQRDAFRQAWQQVIQQHPILRTAFIWEGVAEPVQVVKRAVPLPLVEEDWTHLTSEEQGERLSAFLEADRQRGFDLAAAPLMRLTLIQTAAQTHEFVWSFHHLLLDGWSGPLLLEELFGRYEALRQGQSLSLTSSRPYRDYIAWLQQQDHNEAAVFWRQSLAGIQGPTPFNVDHPSQEESGYGKQTILLSASEMAALRQQARRHQLTLNTLLQGAWAILLSRYSQEADVLFGATISGRPADLNGVETMLGLFINTLPVRVKVEAEMETAVWLQALQAQQIEARRYGYSALSQIQSWSDVPGDLPLFESLLVVENYPVNGASLSELGGHLNLHNVHSFEMTHYPLAVIAVPRSTLSINLFYDSGRFANDTVQRMAGHLHTLLQSMIADLSLPLFSLEMLTVAERQQLLVDWNHTATDSPNIQTIQALFERQVARTPNATAVVYGEQQLSYHELNQQANQLAHHLQKRGIRPEVRVGICLEPSLEVIIAILGVLKAGGTYVPLDPAYPPERLAFMLNDAQIALLLTQQHLVSQLSSHATPLICLDTGWTTIASEDDSNPISPCTPYNHAYVIYTSGSTGRPKGVMVPHRGIGNVVAEEVRLFNVGVGDRILQLASLSFDASVFEIVMALGTGATLYLGNRQALLPGPALVQFLQEAAITVVSLTPSTLAALPQAELPTLRVINVVGEACSPELVRRWAKGRQIFNLYGPTEGTIWTTAVACQDNNQLPPIGRPIAHNEVYLLDQHQQPVPIGVPGELYIGGIGVASGYLHRPGLTAEKFVPNPFITPSALSEADSQAHRLYKTGDLVRYRPDGNLEFLGRIDRQVKIRGFRIEIGEIEAALGAHPAIGKLVVIAHTDETTGDKRLVAYLAPQPHQEKPLAPDELRAFLQAKLPEYMVPSYFITLEALPLTPNGKVDHRALPAPTMHRPDLTQTFVAPRTTVEEMLAQVWCEVIDLEQVGVFDNFFDLGGHSLKATQITSRLRQMLQIDLPLRAIFEQPTIQALAEVVEDFLLQELEASNEDENQQNDVDKRD